MINEIKGISIIWLSKPNLTNLNSGEGESNLVDVKKFKEHGEEYPYVSGQAMRHYVREAVRRELDGDFMCVADDKGETCGEIAKCINCDLFGFMTTVRGKGAVTRVSPVKIATAVGLYPFRENSTLDFLTRRKWTGTEEELRGDIVNVELGVNLYKCGMAVDLARVGGEEEVQQNTRTIVLNYQIDESKRRTRVIRLLDSLMFLADYSKQSRLLADFVPDLICISLQTRYSHRLQKLFEIHNNQGEIRTVDLGRARSILREVRAYSQNIFFGITPGILSTAEEQGLKQIFGEEGISIQSPRDALNAAINGLQP